MGLPDAYFDNAFKLLSRQPEIGLDAAAILKARSGENRPTTPERSREDPQSSANRLHEEDDCVAQHHGQNQESWRSETA